MTAAISQPVRSSQAGPHRGLERRRLRQGRDPFRRPIAAHSRGAFDTAACWCAGHGNPLILDAGCGTAESSVRLARRHPDCQVVAIDRSAARLARSRAPAPPNLLVLRADLRDFYRLAAAAGWRLARHYLLYPNPWPKPGHLGRRWHGHPVFPALLSLGGRLELRTNWRVYAQEFAWAVAAETGVPAVVRPFFPRHALSPFERKYRASGHALFRVRVDLADHGLGRGRAVC